MNLLVLTFYFPPDLSAGSFRAGALVSAIQSQVPSGSSVDVITTLPNRYRSFAAEAPAFEERNGVSVRRIRLRPHASGMADQSAAFAAFAYSAWRYASERRFDLVFATSSRLMTAALGASLARRTNAPLYLDIRDIFADNVRYITPRLAAPVLQRVFSGVERWTVRRANKVNLVSGGFADYFRRRYPDKPLSFFTNGIDETFVSAAPLVPADATRRNASGPATVVYAGNIGEGQGLHLSIPELARRMHGRVRFKVIGDGGRKAELAEALAAQSVDNVELLAPMSRDELLDEYRAADVLFLHLNDYDAFKSVLPSKIFEYAALGKPIWAGVAGFPATFLASEVSNAAVFSPCDVSGGVAAFERLTLRDIPRREFVLKYARSRISRDLARDVLSVAREPSPMAWTTGWPAP